MPPPPKKNWGGGEPARPSRPSLTNVKRAKAQGNCILTLNINVNVEGCIFIVGASHLKYT